jgi:hypothetical protein
MAGKAHHLALLARQDAAMESMVLIKVPPAGQKMARKSSKHMLSVQRRCRSGGAPCLLHRRWLCFEEEH